MVKKIIDVPYDVGVVRFYKGDGYGKSFRGMVSVSNLEDVPEKRVVELPESLLQKLRDLKEQDGLYSFLGDVVKDGVLDDFMIHEGYSDGSLAGNELADWYLGHVEFVAEKEPMYAVDVEIEGKASWAEALDGDLQLWSKTANEARDVSMSEKEADLLIAGLGGERGLLKPRKVKVEG